MKVKVSKALCSKIERIIESGEVDPKDNCAALDYAEKHGLNVAARAIRGNPRRYLQCVNDGMEPTDM